MLKRGLLTFFESIHKDAETSRFFVRLIVLILFLGGLSAALTANYVIEKANWLTLSWDAVDQVQATLSSLFGIITLLSAVFLILELVNRRFIK